ncbi:MAG TPA: Ig-like domain-containing protein [Gemmatimonadaceae bacterium]|nr:Ig-like domain-containing protein [Gemmatimonadaceae bacterium]
MNSDFVRTVRLAPLAFVVLVATQAACGDNGSTDPSKPTAMAAVSPDSQTTAAGVKMAQPLVVRLTGGGDTPIAGTTVFWVINSGGGSLTDSSSTTDADGKAQTTYTPGTEPLTANVSASVGSIRTNFKIVLVPGPATQLAKFGSDNPAAVAGSKLTLAVKLVDAFGNGIADGTVNWAADGGSISATTGTTDKGGVTSVTYTLGEQPGTYTLTATAEGVPAATFTIRAI